MYLHQKKNWWNFYYDKDAVMSRLGTVRAMQGLILGRMKKNDEGGRSTNYSLVLEPSDNG